jgi:hypothetical protein
MGSNKVWDCTQFNCDGQEEERGTPKRVVMHVRACCSRRQSAFRRRRKPAIVEFSINHRSLLSSVLEENRSSCRGTGSAGQDRVYALPRASNWRSVQVLSAGQCNPRHPRIQQSHRLFFAVPSRLIDFIAQKIILFERTIQISLLACMNRVQVSI